MNNNDTQCISAIRVLAADAIQKANSGHPGMVLSAAPMGYALYADAMLHDPARPQWFNRDRFILSAGHGSMLYYALLHMFGYGIDMDQIRQFRQLGSITPGHPEYGVTPGVDATSGPLGQGIAMAVGMAMAQAHVAAEYNRPGFEVCDHYTFALCGDGCLQEGVSAEASSLAGTQKLNKLIVLYDCNKITIEGKIEAFFSEDVAARYRAYNWNVIEHVDGDDYAAITAAIAQAKQSEDKPTLIIVDTKIARHTPLEGSEKTHGEALGDANIAALREALGWEYAPFELPQSVYDTCRAHAEKGVQAAEKWETMMQEYAKAYPELYKQFVAATTGGVPETVDAEAMLAAAKKSSTRDASGAVLNQLSKTVPGLFGGSADLAPSNRTLINGEPFFAPDCREGKNIHFGIREFAMGAICNGMSLHGGIRPYCGTFLVFSDYLRSAVRMSALMEQSVMYVLTHDSFAVGEDGPTHEPVEHLASFRGMPNCHIWRPADSKETVAAYLSALEFNGPSLFAMSRQGLPLYENSGLAALKGAYILSDSEGEPELILIGTGSEVELCQAAAEALRAEGKRVRVVSMRCGCCFDPRRSTTELQ